MDEAIKVPTLGYRITTIDPYRTIESGRASILILVAFNEDVINPKVPTIDRYKFIGITADGPDGFASLGHYSAIIGIFAVLRELGARLMSMGPEYAELATKTIDYLESVQSFVGRGLHK